jgi:hypothetical protein
LVTSEGGGGYAAAHADLFPSKLQQRCPNFPQHLFAPAGVSGGAVSNPLYQAKLPENSNYHSYIGCSGKPNTEAVLAELGTDHLSPVLAALLFQDFPNKVLRGALGPFDRARALALSLSSSNGSKGARVERPYWSHFWRPDVPQGVFAMDESPALV